MKKPVSVDAPDASLSTLKDIANTVGWQYFGVPLLVTGVEDLIPAGASSKERLHIEKEKAELGKLERGIVVDRPGSGRPIGTVTCNDDCTITFPGRDKTPHVIPGGSKAVLYDGAILRTGPKGHAELEYLDGTKTRMGRRTALTPRKYHRGQVDGFFDRLWNWVTGAAEERQQQGFPSAVVGTVSAVPQDYRVAVVTSGGTPATDADEPSGVSPSEARPIVIGQVFYEGVLGPGIGAFGTIRLKRSEWLKLKIYMQQFAPSTETYQGLSVEIADGEGGLIDSKELNTIKGTNDYAEILEYEFEAPDDGVYNLCLRTMGGYPQPNEALKLKVLVPKD